MFTGCFLIGLYISDLKPLWLAGMLGLGEPVYAGWHGFFGSVALIGIYRKDQFVSAGWTGTEITERMLTGISTVRGSSEMTLNYVTGVVERQIAKRTGLWPRSAVPFPEEGVVTNGHRDGYV